ncbi:DUF6243 family protein [Streptomyces sp. NPDC052020]|uniref:DUF6243 family protein n=1 Tax=Streptomyces sp. NPDC052020 TaxID=3155677 RepID=UPI0034463C5C
MSRGGAGNMLGVGGTRRHLGREALRGGGRGRPVGGGLDPQAQKRELLRRLQEKQEKREGAGKAEGPEESQRQERQEGADGAEEPKGETEARP